MGELKVGMIIGNCFASGVTFFRGWRFWRVAFIGGNTASLIVHKNSNHMIISKQKPPECKDTSISIVLMGENTNYLGLQLGESLAWDERTKANKCKAT